MIRTSAHCRKVRRLPSDDRATAAVEFALVLPVALFLFVGVTEVGEAVSISRKVAITARTVTDLVTQNTNVPPSQLNMILAASAQVIAPYSSSNLTVRVSQISTDANGNATVSWSGAWPDNTQALKTGAKFTLPSGLQAPNISLIYGEVTYNFSPVLGYNIIKPIALSDQIYMSPRDSTTITNTGS